MSRLPGAEAELHDRLIDLRADIAWFPVVCLETYCYTLSAALAAGVFPAAFDFGAIASRLRAIGWGELMPLEFMLHPEQIVERLATMPLREFPAKGLPPPPCYDNPLESYYGLQIPKSQDIANRQRQSIDDCGRFFAASGVDL